MEPLHRPRARAELKLRAYAVLQRSVRFSSLMTGSAVISGSVGDAYELELR